MSSIRPPAGRASQIASITSRRPNVAFLAVNPLGPPSAMNSSLGRHGPKGRRVDIGDPTQRGGQRLGVEAQGVSLGAPP